MKSKSNKPLVVIAITIIILVGILYMLNIIVQHIIKKSDEQEIKRYVDMVSAQIHEVELDMKGHYVRVLYDKQQKAKYGKSSEKIYVKISKEEGIKRAGIIMKNTTFGSGDVFDINKGGNYVFALTDDVKI